MISPANNLDLKKGLVLGEHPFFSHAGDKIAFHSIETGIEGWYIIDTGGTYFKQVIDAKDFSWAKLSSSIAWSFDDSKLLSWKSVGDKSYLVQHDIKTMETQNAIELPYFESLSQLQWSKDGDKLYFIASKYLPTTDIYSSNSDGSDVQNLTFETEFENVVMGFEISPTEENIIIKYGEKACITGFINGKIGDIVNCFNIAEYSPCPRWSPNGDLLIFEYNQAFNVIDKYANKRLKYNTLNANIHAPDWK
ncbi:MAG: PD40 domain-containing protein [Saprospiraceae bacterium]|nr:PD40 domain-containing protein [Saprospiraceae bacterium]